ncbi:MAG: thiamine-phosphate kinase [Bacteroidetes bacterium GWA2_40_15]|nr:MAG: thiamine-phosphate kinase [Bacteroidetes bacterium GWA2_40_15]HBQ81900.1 thiamine-phosphate kinase [Bacteroidales bacterium]
MSNSDNNTPISEFGKYGLINHITGGIRPGNKSTVTGIGDDAAVIDSGRNLTLVSTDLFLEGIHFNLIYTPMKHLGYKAVIRAISDIYAMNGTPGQVLISLGISSRFSVEQIEELYEGIGLACGKYKVDLAGGDTTSSLTGLTIGVTAVGFAEKNKIIKRDGAKPNDLICVTGDFGAAFMGLQLLERERKLFQKEKITQPDLSGYEYVIGRQLKPDFPAAVLNELGSEGIIPNSMTDVTEGLASDLLQICKLSGTGCRIYYSKIPIDYETSKLAEEFNVDPMTPALNGGEDYELLFTIPLEDIDRIKSLQSVKVIGHMTSEISENYIVGDDGSVVEISAQGWKGKT